MKKILIYGMLAGVLSGCSANTYNKSLSSYDKEKQDFEDRQFKEQQREWKKQQEEKEALQKIQDIQNELREKEEQKKKQSIEEERRLWKEYVKYVKSKLVDGWLQITSSWKSPTTQCSYKVDLRMSSEQYAFLRHTSISSVCGRYQFLITYERFDCSQHTIQFIEGRGTKWDGSSENDNNQSSPEKVFPGTGGEREFNFVCGDVGKALLEINNENH